MNFEPEELSIILDALRAFTIGVPAYDEARLTLMAQIESELWALGVGDDPIVSDEIDAELAGEE